MSVSSTSQQNNDSLASIAKLNESGDNRRAKRSGSVDSSHFHSNLHRRDETAWDYFIQDLVEDSPFFQENPPKLLPMFNPEEVEVGMKLGQGEFGTVREVASISNTEEQKSLERFLQAHILDGEDGGYDKTESGTIHYHVDGDLTEFSDYSEHTKRSTRLASSRTAATYSTSFKKILEDNVTDAEDDNNTKRRATELFKESRSFRLEDDDDNENENDFNFNLNNKGSNHSTKCSRRSRDDSLANSITMQDFRTARKSIRRRCWREGRARYAVKRVREDLEGDHEYRGTLDLIAEASFLSALTHPNIIKIRATVGQPGDNDYMMVLDRLYMTVEEQIIQWKTEISASKCILLPFRIGKVALEDNLCERIVIGYDVARAFRHLHQHKILYRDLKPSNVGFDIRGDVRLFDLGMAKELRPEDLIKQPEDYNCTGLTGSLRWMAPEVVLCKPYGFSADVYSWGLFFWYLCAMKVPFGNIDQNWHYENVVMKQKRPKKLSCLPDVLNDILKNCWSEERPDRPPFEKICRSIQLQLMSLRNQTFSNGKLRHRSSILRKKSQLSKLIALQQESSDIN